MWYAFSSSWISYLLTNVNVDSPVHAFTSYLCLSEREAYSVAFLCSLSIDVSPGNMLSGTYAMQSRNAHYLTQISWYRYCEQVWVHEHKWAWWVSCYVVSLVICYNNDMFSITHLKLLDYNIFYVCFLLIFPRKDDGCVAANHNEATICAPSANPCGVSTFSCTGFGTLLHPNCNY